MGGKKGPSAQPIFVIQQHEATTLHYDFRLEINGVLKSWTVPKGPTTDSRERRLAIPTEDHPLEYAEFEGTIPEGEYGAGPMLVWDTGAYRNLREEIEGEEKATMEESLEQGKIEVWLEGQKLRGGYVLLRTDAGENELWLLMKMNDETANLRQDPVKTQPKSVLSDRTLEDIAGA